MPRGDKPTTAALALKDGWVYEDALPEMTKEQYDWWYAESLVLDGVRMGPPLTTQNSTDDKQGEALEPFSRPVRIEGWHKGLDGGGWYIKDARNRIILEVCFDEGEEREGRPIDSGNPTARTVVALINDCSRASVAAVAGEDAKAYNGGEIVALQREIIGPVERERLQKATPWVKSLVSDLVQRIYNLRRMAQLPASVTLKTACDYRNTECSSEGVTVSGNWICNNHRAAASSPCPCESSRSS